MIASGIRIFLVVLLAIASIDPALADSGSELSQSDARWSGVMVEDSDGNYFWLDLQERTPGRLTGRLYYGEWSGRLAGEIDQAGSLSLAGREEDTQMRVEGRLNGAGGTVSVTFRNGPFRPWQRGVGLLVRDEAQALNKPELDDLLRNYPSFRLHYGRSGRFSPDGTLISHGADIGRWWSSTSGELCYDVRVPQHLQWCSQVFGADGAYRMLDPETREPVWFQLSRASWE